MRNVLVIDGADNCVYDVFQVSPEDFAVIFPRGTDVAFVDEVAARPDAIEAEAALRRLWSRRIPKASAQGIHGTLFVDLPHKKAYYPTRRDEEAVNPDGSRLR